MLDSHPKTRGHLKTVTAHLYPRNAVPKPQAMETIPQMAHTTEPDQGGSARGHRSAASPPNPLLGAKGEQEEVHVTDLIISICPSAVANSVSGTGPWVCRHLGEQYSGP